MQLRAVADSSVGLRGRSRFATRARWFPASCNAHAGPPIRRFVLSRMAPTRRLMAVSLGKMPTTSVRRLISPSRRSIGLVECSLARCEVGTFGSEALPASHCISFEPRNLATADDGTCTHFVEKIRNIGAIMRPSVVGNRLGQVGFGQSIFAGRCSRDNANGSHPHIHKRAYSGSMISRLSSI